MSNTELLKFRGFYRVSCRKNAIFLIFYKLCDKIKKRCKLMYGWIVVNSFVESAKFQELYSLLLESAKKRGIALDLKKGHDIITAVGDGFDSLPDFAIFWDKDIFLAELLEEAGVRLFNSSRAIDLCDNKAKTYMALVNGGVSIPDTVIAPKTFEGLGYTDMTFLDRAIERLGLPLVIKESYGSFGQQVYLANSREEAVEIIHGIGHKDFVMQRFVASSCGRDLRINVVGKEVIATMYRYNDNDFRSNISNGGSMRAYEPTREQKEVAVRAAEVLGLDFAGVDVMFGDNGAPIVCEVNSNPHFKSTMQCTGVNMAEHIVEYILKKTIG